MKTCKIFKRLTLNKQSIANLNTREMRRLAGGFEDATVDIDFVTDESCNGPCGPGHFHPETYPYHSCVEFC